MNSISLVIPTYKAFGHLKCCIRSVLRLQNIGDFEVVIYGDGGGDDARAAVSQCETWLNQAGIRNVCVYNPVNLGMCPALNNAVTLASRDWICIINDDMVLPNSYIAKSTGFLKPGLVFSTSCIEPPLPGRHLGTFVYPRNLGLDPDNFDHDALDAFQNQLPEAPLVEGVNYPFFMERKVFLEAGGFDEKYPGPYMDPDLFLRLKLAGSRFSRSNSCVVYHFSGVSMRFGEDLKVVRKSANWVKQESLARIYFIEKWGAKPRAKFGEVPRTEVLGVWEKTGPHSVTQKLRRQFFLFWEKARMHLRMLRH